MTTALESIAIVTGALFWLAVGRVIVGALWSCAVESFETWRDNR